MIFDAHIHQHYAYPDDPKTFCELTKQSGIDGGIVFSETPTPESSSGKGDYRWQARMEHVMNLTKEVPGFHPFLWIDPTAPDVTEQIEKSAEAGIEGYKIICELCYPVDCMRAAEAVAATGKPLMFHSGILGGSRERLCGKYNRPIEFECMFAVRNLRFSLAHMGWPWIDDYMAMVAKASFTYDPDFGNRMYIDLTPGTPGLYREDALRKLYLTAYSVKHWVLWGTDNITGSYSTKLPQYWLERDKMFMESLAKDAWLPRQPSQTENPDLSNIFELATSENWKSFLGQ